MKANYPYTTTIKNKRGASKIPHGGILRARAGSLWHKIAGASITGEASLDQWEWTRLKTWLIVNYNYRYSASSPRLVPSPRFGCWPVWPWSGPGWSGVSTKPSRTGSVGNRNRRRDLIYFHSFVFFLPHSTSLKRRLLSRKAFLEKSFTLLIIKILKQTCRQRN